MDQGYSYKVLTLHLISNNFLTCENTFFISLPPSAVEHCNNKLVIQACDIFLMQERVQGYSFSKISSKYFPSLAKIQEFVHNHGTSTYNQILKEVPSKPLYG